MFSFTMKSAGRCIRPSRRVRSGRLLAPILGFLAAFFVLGCPMSTGGGRGNPENVTPSLKGTWSSTTAYGTDGFVITDTAVTYNYTSADGKYKSNFSGSIQSPLPNFTAQSGVIIVKYTSKSANLITTGDYQGIWWRKLGANAVEIAYAYKEGDTEKATLEAAQKAFTQDSYGTYVSLWGPYTK